MKVAVYNRYWNTAGGGEKVAGFAAESFARNHDAWLLSHGQIDLGRLQERLGLDLSAVKLRSMPEGKAWLREATEEFDLLVNCSFGSDDRSGARHGLYYVHFPAPKPAPARRRRAGPPPPPEGIGLEWGEGFHLPEKSRRGVYRWTTSSARLFVVAPRGTRTGLRLRFAPFRPGSIKPADVTIEVGGVPARRVTVAGKRPIVVVVAIDGRGHSEPVEVRIRSDTFVPAIDVGGDDRRELGVVLLDASLEGSARQTLAPSRTAAFLDSYDLVVSNSEYTREWVRRLWSVESRVLYPAVDPQPRGRKEPVILSVGRFFDRGRGHSKKQFEMVRAFRKLVRSGLRGWRYHLVGGCAPEDAPYLERVRDAARGLPVHIHVDASGAELRGLYSRASVLWHATGLGEDEMRTPDRLEHFGISTVEGMSAGAVPIVVGRGGQPEIVDDGRNGFLIKSVRELTDRTRRVAADDALRRRLAEAAVDRSRRFSPERFSERLNQLVDSVVATPAVTGHS
jgi:glycosyltransferase involved in cell wall biosynthesis